MKQKNKMIRYGLFLILPVLMVLAGQYLGEARGAFWLGGNLDPDYVYLLNASNMADLQKVGHIDHPGTPVQMIGAMTLRVVHLLSTTKDNLHADVLKRPETYLKAISFVFMVLNGLMLLLLGVGAYNITGHMALSLLLQCTPFLPGTVLTGSLARVRPEPLLMFTSLLLILFLVKWSGLKEKMPEKKGEVSFSYWPALGYGVIMGFGIATKLTFLPLLVIPLFILPKLKNKLLYLGATFMGFVLFTLPIMGMYSKFMEWIYRLATRKGSYGTGAVEMISWSAALKNIKVMLGDNPLFTGLLVLSIMLILLALMIPALRKLSLSMGYFKLLVGVTVADIVAILMVSKHSAQHYLLPVLSLVGLVLVLIYGYLGTLGEFFKIKREYVQIPFWVVLAGVMLWLNPLQELKKTASNWTLAGQQSNTIYQKVAQDYKEYGKIYYYPSSSPAYALKFGNDLSLNKHTDVLKQIYPGVYFYDFGSQGIFTFDYNERVQIGHIQAKYGAKIVFQGANSLLLNIPGLKLLRESVPGCHSEYLFLPDQKEVKVFDTIRAWIVKNVPRGSALVVPVESAALVARLQQDYAITLQEMRKVSEPGFLNLAMCLENPYFMVPSPLFYGKNKLSPKFIKRLEKMRELMAVECTLPAEDKPQFFIGRWKGPEKDVATIGNKTKGPKYDELQVWLGQEMDQKKISPQLKTLSTRGKFTFDFKMGEAGNELRVKAVERAKAPTITFNIFGYNGDKKGLNLDIAKIDTVYFVARVLVTENLMNADNHLFIQDFTSAWEREKVFFPVTGWLTYVIAKKIRPQSTQLLWGLRFTPKTLEDEMVVKDVKVFIGYK